jgi:hypothetical protein
LQSELNGHFEDVEVFTYWSTQGALLYRLGARTALRTDFGLKAAGRH